MKIKIVKEEIIEVPDGEYCQTEDGVVKCKYFYFDIDPFCGAEFCCSKFDARFDVPYDDKPLGACRNIKKCEKCKQCEVLND